MSFFENGYSYKLFPDNVWLIILWRLKNKISKSLQELNGQEIYFAYFNRTLKLKDGYPGMAPGPMSTEFLLLLGI